MQCYFYFYFFKKRATLEVEFYQCGRGTSQSNFSSCFPFRSVEAEAVAGRRAVVVGVCGGGVVGHGSGAWSSWLSQWVHHSRLHAGRTWGCPSVGCMFNQSILDGRLVGHLRFWIWPFYDSDTFGPRLTTNQPLH